MTDILMDNTTMLLFMILVVLMGMMACICSVLYKIKCVLMDIRDTLDNFKYKEMYEYLIRIRKPRDTNDE